MKIEIKWMENTVKEKWRLIQRRRCKNLKKCCFVITQEKNPKKTR